jgi:tetratricopeptide (TPR) repeat protein
MGDRFQMERVRADLGGSYLNAKEYLNAIEYCEPARAYFRSISAWQPYSSVLVNLANAYRRLDKLEEAEKYARECLATEETLTRPYALYALGYIIFKRQNYEGALQYFRESLELAQKNEEATFEPDIHQALGEVYQAQGKFALARTEFESALQQYKQAGLEAYVAEAETLIKSLDSTD